MIIKMKNKTKQNKQTKQNKLNKETKLDLFWAVFVAYI